VLFGPPEALVGEGLAPGVAASGIVSKSSAGYLALAGVVREALAAAAPASASAIELEQWPLPACLVAADGSLTQANAAWVTMLATTPSDLAGSTLDEWLDDPGTLADWRALRDDAARRGPLELVLQAADGTPRQLHVARCGTQGFVATASAAGAAINVVNAGSREQANREIHDIAMVFSHDLKEPLHQITRLAQRLGGDGDALGSADTTKLTEQLQTCARRAGAMLNGMLEYLSVSSRDEQPGLVDLNRCLEEALDNLRVAIDDSAAHIVSDQLPSVAGDPYQLMHLLQNVLGNAIKFRGRERPEIRITASAGERMWRIVVQDNGIGISEAFRERVFEMGKRLHTPDEYPGAGIGLTLCRRIAERHGGSIGIESGDGRGSRVVIELPRAPEHVSRLA
jgi:signal transduction histidine kinase